MTIAALDVKMYGVAVVRGWEPDDFERRLDVVNDLLTPGSETLKRFRYPGHLAGMWLEDATLSVCSFYGIRPTHEASSENQFVNVGLQILLDQLTGATSTPYNNANAALGAGDSNAAFSLAQTNLQGAVVTTDRVRKAMNATFPSRSGQTVTFQSNFATTDANFTWNEWAIFNNVTDGSGTMLNRAVASLGTKTSAQAWTLTATITPA